MAVRYRGMAWSADGGQLRGKGNGGIDGRRGRHAGDRFGSRKNGTSGRTRRWGRCEAAASESEHAVVVAKGDGGGEPALRKRLSCARGSRGRKGNATQQ